MVLCQEEPTSKLFRKAAQQGPQQVATIVPPSLLVNAVLEWPG